MRIFVTGGTGFVGRETVTKLHAAGHDVRCLVRKGSEKKLPEMSGIEPVYGDALDVDSLVGAMDGCDAVVSTHNSSMNAWIIIA